LPVFQQMHVNLKLYFSFSRLNTADVTEEDAPIRRECWRDWKLVEKNDVEMTTTTTTCSLFSLNKDNFKQRVEFCVGIMLDEDSDFASNIAFSDEATTKWYSE